MKVEVYIMTNYTETKKALDKIKSKYCCAGDLIFRAAIEYVVQVGQETCKNKEWLDEQIQDIHIRHNKAEAEGKTLWITSNFEIAIIECASELVYINTIDLLVYVQREVYLDNDDISYQRAIELLHSCMNWFVDYDCCSNHEMLQRFNDLDFADNELQQLGFGWLFEEEDEE